MLLLRHDAGSNSGSSCWKRRTLSLLADLRATMAIAPMLGVLAETEWEHIIHDRIVLRLPDLGADVLEPALEMLADDPTDDLADALCSIVSKLGVQDERIYSALSSHFGRIPEIACSWFVDYRDQRALPMLRKEIEDTVPDHHSALGLHPLVDLAEAYELLAGELPHELRTHVDELIAHWRVLRVSVPKHSPPPPKIGRNDPCPCGSGKKYKRCHFGSTTSPHDQPKIANVPG